MSPVRRLARPLLAAGFVVGGAEALRNPGPHVALAESAGLSDAERLVRLNSATQLAGGVLLAANRLPRLTALVLAGTLLPTAAVRDAFWSETDPQAKARKKQGLLSDLGILGGLLVATADTGGRESVPHAAARLSRRARRKAAKRAAALESAAQRLSERAQEQAGRAADLLPVG